MRSTFRRIGQFLYRGVSKREKQIYKGNYILGEIGYEVPIKLTKKQLEEASEFAIEIFGEDIISVNTPCTATVYFQIANKTKYDKVVKQQTI